MGSGYALVQFDLSSISNFQVSSAVLSLFVTISSVTDGSSKNVYISRITESWSESLVTWNSQPSFTPVGQVSQNIAHSYTGWVSWNITFFINDILSNNIANNGFMITSDYYDTNYKVFYSSDYTMIPTIRPMLTITGQFVPEPTSLIFILFTMIFVIIKFKNNNCLKKTK